MAGSTLSLDSLSSPSPSPSPPPVHQMPLGTNTTHTGPPATSPTAPFRAIDTDSELSELTDDDQDASTAADKRAASIATASSSKDPGGNAIDDDGDTSPTGSRASGVRSRTTHTARRGQPPYPNPRTAARRKRSSIVPAPMWGWVPEKTAANAAVVEEEEEEMTAPPRVMEEEEEEEEEIEEEGDDYDAYDHGNDSGGGEDEEAHNPRSLSSQRRQGPYPSKRVPHNQPNSAKTRGSLGRQPNGAVKRLPRKQDIDYDHEDGDDDTLKAEKRPRQPPNKRLPPKHDNDDVRPKEEDDDGSASGGSEYLSAKKKKATRSRAAASNSRKRKENGNDESSDSDAPVSSRKKNGVKLPNGDHHEHEDGTTSIAEDNSGSDVEMTKVVTPVQLLSPSKLTSAKPLSVISPSTGNAGPSALSTLAALANAVDLTHSPSREMASITAAAAAVTSNAGASSSVEIPETTTTSGAGTRHASPARSRSVAAESDAEDSADEARPAKGKAKSGKPASRGSRSKTRGKPPPIEKKSQPVTTNGEVKAANPGKKGPPAPLDLKIDTSVSSVVASVEQAMEVDEEEEPHDPVGDVDVDMEGSDQENDEDEDGEDEVELEDAHEDEEEPEAIEEEAVEVEQDPDEEAAEADDDAPDRDGDDDQEQENEHEAAEGEQENEEGEDVDNDDEHASHEADVDVDVEDHESDLQPAHRAEALDVLATIELKFALLRERVYVEKMEALAWEETLVQNAAHPELQHLQKELSKRRDKRLELASRKRSYEMANAVTRRKTDENHIWSWWQFSRDDLQTEMIAETSRKRRKLERERRAIERPQPIRLIPHPMEVIAPPMGPPSIRKIVKQYPFGSRKHNKSDTHHHSHPHFPKNLVYPEISTLSTTDIKNDLEFLSQFRRNSAYDQHQQQAHYPSQLQRNASGMNGMSIGRSMSMGMGIPNGALPPMQAQQAAMGPPPPGSIPHPHLQQLGMGYEPYGDIAHAFGPPGASGRARDQYNAQGPAGPMSGGPPQPGSSRENMNVYSNFPPGARLPPPPHGPPMLMGGGAHQGYPGDHEMSTMAPGPGNNGIGHQIHPNHPYFGQGSMGPGGSGSGHGPMPPSAHMSGHHAGNMKPGMGMNGRRSISPVHAMPNGHSGAKTNGNWVGGGMDGGYAGGSGGKEWDARMIHEEEERDRVMRDRERKRDEREKEKEQQRDRELERERAVRREREYDLDRERLGHQHIQQMSQQQQQHRQPPSSAHGGLAHIHGSNGPPAQGPVNNHAAHNHHHHRPPHHHHVVHRHHPQQGSQHASSSMPLPGGGAPPITHSPRSAREYEGSRPPQGPMHAPHGQVHPTELITLSTNKRDASEHWPNKTVEDPQHHANMVDYRERERDAHNREPRKMVSGRHSTGPAMPPLDDRGDRPMAMPFVMASSHTMQQTTAGMSTSHMNGSGLSSSTSSPRGAPSWNGPGAMEDPSYRTSSSAPPPSGYPGSPHDARARSPVQGPVQGHRYGSSSGSHVPPPLGRLNNSSSSGMNHRMTPPLPPSGRARPPPSPSYPPPASHHSPATSPKLRPLSPVLVNSSGKHILAGPLPGPGYSSPHLSGPGRASTPTGHQGHSSSSSGPPPMQDVVMKNGNLPPYGGSRTASPMVSALPGSGRPNMNGGSGGGDRDRIDRDRERPSPHLGASSAPLAPTPPSKLSSAQMVDGH